MILSFLIHLGNIKNLNNLLVYTGVCGAGGLIKEIV